jgi:3-methyladenine DNA glycosylase AlkD
MIFAKARIPEGPRFLARFFKTGQGDYGHGDVFLGLTVPQSRKIAEQYADLSLVDIKKLLRSKIHEQRLVALLILVSQFTRAGAFRQTRIFRFYLAHSRLVNNWDLADLSADKIVGAYLFRRGSLGILEKFAGSSDLWQRRIAIVATFHFIKNGQSGPTLRIAKKLLRDQHDLIHKAVGWMLREVGKRCSQAEEERFLRKNYRKMPRTMLRYAIERFPRPLQRKYLAGKI